MNRLASMPSTFNVLCLEKGAERYIFLYDETTRIDAIQTAARFAADPELSLNWRDAAQLAGKIGRESYVP